MLKVSRNNCVVQIWKICQVQKFLRKILKYKKCTSQNSAKAFAVISAYTIPRSPLSDHIREKWETKNLAKVLTEISADMIFRSPLSDHVRDKGENETSRKKT